MSKSLVRRAKVVSSTTTIVEKETYQGDLSEARWLCSSQDESEGEAVEVAFIGDLVAIRKQPKPGQPAGPVLIFTMDEWDAFVDGAKDGEFDLD